MEGERETCRDEHEADALVFADLCLLRSAPFPASPPPPVTAFCAVFAGFGLRYIHSV
jgi:hypothetical protein